MMNYSLHRGEIIDLPAGRIFPGEIEVGGGRIAAIRETAAAVEPGFLSPGLVDAHIHLESTLLTPAEFARIAVKHGTVGTVSDPHEIANVLGIEGVRLMQQLATKTPCKIHFGIPSCVPATQFETAGAELGPAEVEALCRDPDLLYLSEMMNFPGVCQRDPQVMAKLDVARRYGKRIDGHAPGLRGEALSTYVRAGIETDHECFSLDEAREKLRLGMKILIREGSAARNFDALWPLLLEQPEQCMFCSDDKHPDDLLRGHINELCARAVAHGVPPIAALRAAALNPVEHYRLRCGLLRVGDPADFIRLADLESFRVLETWIDGQCVATNGRSHLPRSGCQPVNRFDCSRKTPADFAITPQPGRIRAIRAVDGELVTGVDWLDPRIENGLVVADPSHDLLKITVVNRYRDAPPANAFVTGIGLRAGAIASSVAHDCHNIIAVGASDTELARAVNLVIAHRGGIALAGPDGVEDVLPLPLAGLISDRCAEEVAAGYERLTANARQLGSRLQAPFMTLSFLALLVIPELKLSDRGLFDSSRFRFVSNFELRSGTHERDA
jgi:adenine deaminase